MRAPPAVIPPSSLFALLSEQHQRLGDLVDRAFDGAIAPHEYDAMEEMGDRIRQGIKAAFRNRAR